MSKLASSTLYDEDVHFGTHLEIWGSWYDSEQKKWGFACCRSTEPKKRQCPKNAPVGGQADEAEEEAPSTEVRVTQRVADMLYQCPSFSGDVPTPDQEKQWTLEELRNYFFSNGLIRPARLRGEKRDEPTAADWKALGLEVGTSIADARRAYKRLALAHHPDKHTGEKEKAAATEKFRRLVEAFEAISGHAAEVPALSATTEATKKRKWHVVVVEPVAGES
mmetsp:Transcript_51740/g.123140  ORF Transcript_51740/g.123140 Transcript_51740/m.123140 type:complete len:221 (-) Transcript_51740:92-754(-)